MTTMTQAEIRKMHMNSLIRRIAYAFSLMPNVDKNLTLDVIELWKLIDKGEPMGA